MNKFNGMDSQRMFKSTMGSNKKIKSNKNLKGKNEFQNYTKDYQKLL